MKVILYFLMVIPLWILLMYLLNLVPLDGFLDDFVRIILTYALGDTVAGILFKRKNKY